MSLIRTSTPRRPQAPLHKQQKGSSLIEILVSLLVLAIGLLGMASLQSKSIQFNHSAYLRTQATLLASDIIDRMRINDGQANAYVIGTGPASGDPCSSNCLPDEIATTDLIEWKDNLVNQLPEGNGTITAIAGTTNGFNITIQWMEREAGKVIEGEDGEEDREGVEIKSFVTGVQI